MNYLTGKGFLGSVLAKKLDKVEHIPHDKIQSTKLSKFDNFYFLSTYGNMSFHDDEFATYKANIEDLLYVLKQLDGKDFNSFVYVSSSSVSRKIQTVYSRAKKAAEEILLSFMEKNNVPICIIRPFSITGVGDQKEHLLPTLLDGAFNGKVIQLVPDACHDWIDVEDVVDAILSLSKNRARGIFQVGTGTQYANIDVLKAIESVTRTKIAHSIIKSMHNYDSNEWVSTNFKARSWGWLPKKDLNQIIKEMVEAYDKTIR